MVSSFDFEAFCLEAIGKPGPGMRLALAQTRESTHHKLQQV
jgi:hypothetical protein